MQEKGKRKVVENPEGEKRCKMKADLILEEEVLATKEKRK